MKRQTHSNYGHLLKKTPTSQKKQPYDLGWKDSNLRMAVPKTAALPLGDTPSGGLTKLETRS